MNKTSKLSEITFITGNIGKYTDAKELFLKSGIKLLMEKKDAPEIQSNTSAEVTIYSANIIAEKLNKPFFVMDRGIHIDALNGFPGPYIKYINNCLSSENILAMMDNESNRVAYWVTAISCYIPEKGIETFIGTSKGTIALTSQKGKGCIIDEIFIPEGADKAFSRFTELESTDFWNSNPSWDELLDYLKKV